MHTELCTQCGKLCDMFFHLVVYRKKEDSAGTITVPHSEAQFCSLKCLSEWVEKTNSERKSVFCAAVCDGCRQFVQQPLTVEVRDKTGKPVLKHLCRFCRTLSAVDKLYYGPGELSNRDLAVLMLQLAKKIVYKLEKAR